MILWEILRKLSACYTLLVYDLEFTTPCWTATLSLLHLNQFGGGGRCTVPLTPSPSIRQCTTGLLDYIRIHYRCNDDLSTLTTTSASPVPCHLGAEEQFESMSGSMTFVRYPVHWRIPWDFTLTECHGDLIAYHLLKRLFYNTAAYTDSFHPFESTSWGHPLYCHDV